MKKSKIQALKRLRCSVQPTRTNDPDSSKKWAEAYDADWITRIFLTVCAHGQYGAGKPEFSEIWGYDRVHVFSPVPARLVDAGLIFDSGKRRDSQIVWMDSELESDYINTLDPACEEYNRYMEAKLRRLPKRAGTCPSCKAELIYHNGKLSTSEE